jgi:tRNA pseudouridine38-40 synthase
LTLFDPDLAAHQRAGAGPASEGTDAPVAPVQQAAATPVARRLDDTPGVTTRLRLGVSYDGTGFRGFAAQPGVRTVAGVLADAIAVVVGHRVELVCAGRTDAGVHATGQVVHADVRADVDPGRLLRSVNTLVGPELVVRSVAPAPEGFDARRSARARRYRYLIYEAATPDPMLSRQAWCVTGPLDLRAMVSAADAVVGEHDFRAFCRRAPGSAPGAALTRRVLETHLAEVPANAFDRDPGARLLRFDITATSFCHQMVRSIAGILVEVGRGRRTVADVAWLLQAGDRSRVGGVIAPPHGLCLVGVDYGE